MDGLVTVRHVPSEDVIKQIMYTHGGAMTRLESLVAVDQLADVAVGD